MTTEIVLADTHIRRGSKRRLPPAAYHALEQADLVLHAGDVVCQELLDELAGFAPTLAVLGNNDTELAGRVPEERLVTVEGLRIGMVHDSGPRAGRERRLRRRFPHAEVVVFGHSHIPIDAPGIDGQWLHNPGSPTARRRQPVHTIGRLEIDDGRLLGHAIVPVSE
jgi:putative phosphoesterase